MHATYLSGMFFLFYIPQNVTQNTMSQLLSDNFDSLGFSLQATLYLCSMLGSIVAPAFI